MLVDFSTTTSATSVALATATQSAAPWGLARISVRDSPFSTPTSEAEYKYETTGGTETWAYVLDTGINTRHKDFERRAKFGINLADRTHQDHHDHQGHGTWVAGIIGSKTYGVAKQTKIVSVKVMTGLKSTDLESHILEGLDWIKNEVITHDHANRSVVNISLGAHSKAVGLAIQAMTEIGVFVGMSAGE